jgi:hypothetical protein
VRIRTRNIRASSSHRNFHMFVGSFTLSLTHNAQPPGEPGDFRFGSGTNDRCQR